MPRRAFSPEIVCSDRFLDMPVTARDLYIQLGMNADDDGFVSPKRIMRMLGASDDDLRILLAKDFVIPFESGVLVITDWKINNTIRKDWHRDTIYQKEKVALQEDEKGRYILVTEPLQFRQHSLVMSSSVKLSNKEEKTPPLSVKEFLETEFSKKVGFVKSDLFKEKIAFIEYWLEPSQSGKTRYEGEKYFDIRRRWGTWLRNKIKWSEKEKKESGYGAPPSFIAEIERMRNTPESQETLSEIKKMKTAHGLG